MPPISIQITILCRTYRGVYLSAVSEATPKKLEPKNVEEKGLSGVADFTAGLVSHANGQVLPCKQAIFRFKNIITVHTKGKTVTHSAIMGIPLKAIIWTKYGAPEVLQLQEVDKPTPKDNEVLIKVHATTVTAGECEIRSLKLPFWLRVSLQLWLGIRKPRKKILGQEVAGEVEAVGNDVERFRKGDQVFGTTGFSFGADAQYVCLPVKPQEGNLAIKPANVTFQEAAALPLGGLEALHFLRKGNIQSGQKVLIVGAGGSIGTFAVQLARYCGAEVTGVDRAEKLDMIRSLGAAHVIDYAREDFTKNGETYDAVLDVVGKSPFSGSVKSLKPNGRYLLANPSLSDMLRGRWTSIRGGGKKVIFGASDAKPEDLIYLQDLLAAGTIKTVIGKSFRLEDIVEAHHYVESGQKKGNVVITVEHDYGKVGLA